MNRTLITSIFLVLVLSGCATMNKSECLSADWYTVGFEDGVAGHPESRIGAYRKDCAEYGVSPKLSLYRKGHYQGSEKFCVARNGFQRGRSGHHYSNNCPADLESEFLQAFNEGRHLHSIDTRIKKIRTSIANTSERFDEVTLLIEKKRELMIADGLVREERASILDEIRSLNEERLSIQDELLILEDVLIESEKAYHESLDKLNVY